MKLVLIRHGEAENSFPDADRKLSEKGRFEIMMFSEILANTGWSFTEVRHSPLVRTTETASIIHTELKKRANANLDLIEDSVLSPGLDLDLALDRISNYEYSDAAVWIFHMPDVARVLSSLLGIPESSMYIQPGTMTALNLAVPNFQSKVMLIWMLQPDLRCKLV